jgi:hypothetical protein
MKSRYGRKEKFQKMFQQKVTRWWFGRNRERERETVCVRERDPRYARAEISFNYSFVAAC